MSDSRAVLLVPVRRPVATTMFFVALVLVGVAGLARMPVELVPHLGGDQLEVFFSRPGSEPETVERELLIPLEARLSELEGLEESWATVRGSSGSLTALFAPGTDLAVRDLELRQVAADLVRRQPEGTAVEVSAQDTSAMSQFIMVLTVRGGGDVDALRDLVDERVAPRLAAVPGVSRAMVTGGAPRELRVEIDAGRVAALGLEPLAVQRAIGQAVGDLESVGTVEGPAGRAVVLLDARAKGPVSLGEAPLAPGSPLRLRHVAEVEPTPAEISQLYRVDGRTAVGVVLFKESGANLVAVGRALRARIDELDSELAPYGVELRTTFDAADMVEEQIGRLEKLALTGFLVALVVLFGFLRRVRAVAVVAVAVPISLLCAMALLYLAGQTINLLTLFGLAVGIGMLVDNSIVVYEAVQRQLERGASPDDAAGEGVYRTLRAILAATATNAVVFLPLLFVDFASSMIRAMLLVLALAILLPLLASVLVAVGFVPLLARRLAAPAALARLAERRRRRAGHAALAPPDRSREVFAALLVVALRRPAVWLAGAGAGALLTAIIALPLLLGGTAAGEAQRVDQVQTSIDLDAGLGIERATALFERLEQAVAAVPGVEQVESMVGEEGGWINARIADDAPPLRTPARVRRALEREAAQLGEVQLRPMEQGRAGEGGDPLAAAMGQAPGEFVLSGPDNAVLATVAEELRGRLESVPEVGRVWVTSPQSPAELRVVPDRFALRSHGLTVDRTLAALGVVRREGIRLRSGFVLPDGRELPVVLRTAGARERTIRDLAAARVATPGGVRTLGEVASFRVHPGPPTIRHHDGRRELAVRYTLGAQAPRSGPLRQQVEERIAAAAREVHRPEGTVLAVETADEELSWFRSVVLPIVLLLFGVLALVFESLTLPILVLVALPLTLIGGAWALLLSGHPVDQMAAIGALALLGLTVNPAILLVDRMRVRTLHGHWSAGAAALAAVRERARPVLMTTLTTIAGLWPLALATGRENELWPPFATVVIGGLASSALLTLLAIPAGFVLLRRLDVLFGRLGPWVVLAWLAATTAIVWPLFATDLVGSLTWQVVTTLLVGGLLLGVIAFAWRREPPPVPAAAPGTPPVLEVRGLRKVYGRPGPLGRAWQAPAAAARRAAERGSGPADTQPARERIVPFAMLLVATAYLFATVESFGWRVVLLFVAALLVAALARAIRAARGHVDELGRARRGGLAGWIATFAPWAAFCWVAWRVATSGAERVQLVGVGILLALLGLFIALVQLAGRTARSGGPAGRGLRGWWRRTAARWHGEERPQDEVRALDGIDLRVERGMIGVLGPNGAGKTTLLRTIAGILEPSRGVVVLGGVRLERIRRWIGRTIGYLPQDFGLPAAMTAREYLDYWALLYEVEPAAERRARVDRLLREVGLGSRAGERIGRYSGGMRQRVAVARTLLRLPPVIIVDEPTVGLDPRERIRFRNLLARLAADRIVLFSTHVVEDVASTCDRVVVVARGRIVFDGGPGDLVEQARGRVWTVRLPAEVTEREALAPGANIVDRLPDAAGGALLRILADARPHPAAEPAAPNIEDGYLALTGARREAAS
jgi:multidrug efflux pump subunit AcrB/ABC-type multidrug transport system ATPase subunit